MKIGFEVINVMAVLGTSFLMLALYAVWRTPLLFGKYLKIQADDDSFTKRSLLRMGLVALALFAGFVILSYVVAIAPLASVESLHALFALLILTLALSGVQALSNKHSLRTYLVDSLFCGVCIIGGTFLILMWPS